LLKDEILLAAIELFSTSHLLDSRNEEELSKWSKEGVGLY